MKQYLSMNCNRKHSNYPLLSSHFHLFYFLAGVGKEKRGGQGEKGWGVGRVKRGVGVGRGKRGVGVGRKNAAHKLERGQSFSEPIPIKVRMYF